MAIDPGFNRPLPPWFLQAIARLRARPIDPSFTRTDTTPMIPIPQSYGSTAPFAGTPAQPLPRDYGAHTAAHPFGGAAIPQVQPGTWAPGQGIGWQAKHVLGIGPGLPDFTDPKTPYKQVKQWWEDPRYKGLPFGAAYPGPPGKPVNQIAAAARARAQGWVGALTTAQESFNPPVRKPPPAPVHTYVPPVTHPSVVVTPRPRPRPKPRIADSSAAVFPGWNPPGVFG